LSHIFQGDYVKIKQQRRVIQIISVFLLAGGMLVLAGCIVDVIQPDSAMAGETFEAEALIGPSDDPWGTTHPLYLGIRLPRGWNVVGNPTYSGGPTGTVVYSPAIVSELETQFGVISDTIWWGGAGPREHWSAQVTVTAIIKIRTSVMASGAYTLSYVGGTDTEPPTWGAVVSKSIAITPAAVYSTYLPVILGD
jgi:hypothetical protein